MALRLPKAPYQAGEFLTCCFALRLEFYFFRNINFLSHTAVPVQPLRCDLCNIVGIVQIQDEFAFLEETHVALCVVSRFGKRIQEKSLESARARYSTFT